VEVLAWKRAPSSPSRDDVIGASITAQEASNVEGYFSRTSGRAFWDSWRSSTHKIPRTSMGADAATTSSSILILIIDEVAIDFIVVSVAVLIIIVVIIIVFVIIVAVAVVVIIIGHHHCRYHRYLNRCLDRRRRCRHNRCR
jgi:Flp pilus assembly protein TadB